MFLAVICSPHWRDVDEKTVELCQYEVSIVDSEMVVEQKYGLCPKQFVHVFATNTYPAPGMALKDYKWKKRRS